MSTIEKISVVKGAGRTREQKVIRDSVHGYIYIDNDIFENIIDTEYYQRLRRIEQTSMRCLYPAARHDRFIHSIGVYYLSKMAVKAIEASVKKNAACLGSAIPEPDYRNDINFSFEMAALLHDVGHAPFSHTLEGFFGIKEIKDIEKNEDARKRRKQNMILDLCEKAQQVLDLDDKKKRSLKGDLVKSAPASHELMSALMIMDCFYEPLTKIARSRKCAIDWIFLIRSITGALYYEAEDYHKEYKNGIIRLLNSSIDIDKLDYISRDSSISGYDNVTIDIPRLLKALIFVPYLNENGEKKITIAFNKTAISVVQNAILSRNALYTWIYAHHKVKYETFLLESAIEIIVKEKSESEKVKFFEDYFSLKALKENLICDDDIWCLLKSRRKDYEQINEIFCRNRQKKTVWKSFSEFEALFFEKNEKMEIGEFSTQVMQRMIENEAECKRFEEYLNRFSSFLEIKKEIKFQLIVHNVKLVTVEHNNILIYLNDKLYGYDAIINGLYPNSISYSFFYLFFEREFAEVLKENKERFIQYIKDYSRFRVQPRF